MLRTAKRALRRSILDPVQSRVASWRVGQCVRSFRAGETFDAGAIARLRRAWGNEDFSADVAYIRETIARVGRCRGPVLECGSGLTTLVAALVAEGRQVAIWSLEQDAEWARFVGDRLRANDIRNVELRYVPLKRSGDFVWYDIEGVDLPSRFELVLCDGPAVFDHWGEAYPQWRYGLLPVLSGRHVAIDGILLDDADEPRAARLLSRWKQEFDLDHTMLLSREGSCAVVHRASDSTPSLEARGEDGATSAP